MFQADACSRKTIGKNRCLFIYYYIIFVSLVSSKRKVSIGEENKNSFGLGETSETKQKQNRLDVIR